MSERLSELRREQFKALSQAWEGRMNDKLARLLSQGNIQLNQFFEVLWSDGVMGRLVPDDPEEMAAREELDKPVWAKGKEDPELYWRTMYAAEKVRNAMKHGYSVVADSSNCIYPAFNALLHRVYGDSQGKLRKLFPGLATQDEGNPSAWLLDKLEERSRQELRRLGAEADRPILPVGAVGAFHGFRVSVDAYADDGRLWLKGETKKDHMGIYQWMKDGGVSPAEVDPEDFHLPEKRG